MVTMPISGQPRENEAALYWAYAERGWTASATRVAPSTVYNGTSVDDMTKNFDACDIYATYMNQGNVGTMTDRLWLSFHSNASNGNGVTRGTLGLINSSPTPNQAALAMLAGQTVQNEMAALDGTVLPAQFVNATGFSNIGANTSTAFDKWKRYSFSQDLAYFKNFLGTHNLKFGYGFNHGIADEQSDRARLRHTKADLRHD